MQKKIYKTISVALCIALTMLSSCGLDYGRKDYARAVAAYERGEYETASAYFQKALEKNEDKAEYYLYNGFNLLELQEYKKAAESFEKVILDKDFTFAKENNKRAYRGMGIAFYLSKDYEKAAESFWNALAITELPELNEDLGTRLEQVNHSLLYQYRVEGRLDEAQELCIQMLERYGETKELYCFRADLAMEQGRFEEAYSEFSKAGEIGDVGMNTRLGMIAALRALGREQEAEEAAQHLLAMTPQNESEGLAQAIAAFTLEEYGTAQEMLKPLYEKGNTEAVYYLARIYLAQEDYADAEKLFRELSATRGADAEINYSIALCCFCQEKTEEAEEYLGKLEETGAHDYLRQSEKMAIVILEKQSKWEEAYRRMTAYMEKYITASDAEYEEAQKELAFLKRCCE